MHRREFLLSSLALLSGCRVSQKSIVMTVNGPIAASELGLSLIHEHFLVDFIGADKISSDRWDKEKVITKVRPFIDEVMALGVKSIFDCTPAFLGRDGVLLKKLSDLTGIQIITNTGYYGAIGNKYLPSWALTESAEQFAARWIDEYRNGIDGTSVKPGFIKISVDAANPLSDVHQKLVRAAAITHLETGLTICSHTGPFVAAIQEIGILAQEGDRKSVV